MNTKTVFIGYTPEGTEVCRGPNPKDVRELFFQMKCQGLYRDWICYKTFCQIGRLFREEMRCPLFRNKLLGIIIESEEEDRLRLLSVWDSEKKEWLIP